MKLNRSGTVARVRQYRAVSIAPPPCPRSAGQRLFCAPAGSGGYSDEPQCGGGKLGSARE